VSQDKVIIVGAGLCGSLLAIRLAQHGLNVALYESRPDMRGADNDSGRSINLALSDRGLMALDRVGLKEKIQQHCIPMRGRLIHPQDGGAFLSPYSGRADDYINSVSRAGLNIALLNAAEQLDNLQIYFGAAVKSVDLEQATITFTQDGQQHQHTGSVVIGTDGAGSVVRRAFMKDTSRLLFNYHQNFLRHGYKELTILPTAEGSWRIEKEALHIWPRGDFMIIALPNLDGSFTLTMFHPYETKAGFNQLNSREKLTSFFEEYYPTLIPHCPHYADEYFENPVGILGTIKCQPWQAYDRCLLMGDAAHAIVPFYGQGMNASFEDVRIFDDLFSETGTDWSKLFGRFEESRIENANAIADLAVDNFIEMRDRVDDLPFIRKRKIEMELEQQYPEYYSKYSLVTFKPELPYRQAMIKGRQQDQLLLELCSREDFEQIPLSHYMQELRQLDS